jgi:murein DD-endopeptidase MepM/ murein hydrolase activator NlpD
MEGLMHVPLNGSITATMVFAMAVALMPEQVAAADAAATVKARTQRMTQSNLNSQQDGWYDVGDRVTLICSTRGQAVRGHFSFNIPNGGWDALWYKTSDGHYVADVDIETGSLNAVAPECSVAPPAPQRDSSGLRWPLDSVNIVQGFGADPAFYRQFKQNGHNGIDLAAPVGTAVYAAKDGTVTFEGWGKNNPWMGEPAGICVLLNHGDIHTGYAHMSRTVVNAGQHVSKGELIGYSGATGVASGPHLHFEVLPQNPDFSNGFAGRIDPVPLLN